MIIFVVLAVPQIIQQQVFVENCHCKNNSGKNIGATEDLGVNLGAKDTHDRPQM